MPRFPALWKAYQNVVFQLEDRAPSWPSFAIITASNPASLTCASLVNRCANAALARRLRRRGYVRLFVCSLDLSYHEHSFATPLPLNTALRLALRFRQVAIYYVCSGRLCLASVSSRRLPYRPVALGAYSAQSATRRADPKEVPYEQCGRNHH